MRDRASIGARELGLALGLVGLTGAQLLLAAHAEPAPAAAAALLCAVIAAGARSAPVTAAVGVASVTSTAFLLGASMDDQPGVMYLSVGLVAYSLGEWAQPSWSWPVVFVMVLATYGIQILADGGDTSPVLLYAVAGPWLAGLVVRSRRRLAGRLQQTMNALASERAAYVELAVERERRYVARELHDIVGHAMSLIVIQAAAGRHLARSAPDRATQALDAIVDAGQQAQVEIERLRGLLVEQDRAGLDSLPTVVAQAAAAGLRISITARPASVQLEPAVDETALRVVQEALTNVIKHAGGARVAITLESIAGRLRLEVRNGPGRRHPELVTTGGGRGLRGMRARARSVRGQLDAGPIGEDWHVVATLPLRPSVTAAPTDLEMSHRPG